MDAFTLLRQGVLFAHVVAFAIALSTVLRADAALMKARRLDADRLANTARIVTHALAALWATGLTLVALDVGLDVAAFKASPKLAAKLLVVSALTANGFALHALVFPMLSQPAATRWGIRACCPRRDQHCELVVCDFPRRRAVDCSIDELHRLHRTLWRGVDGRYRRRAGVRPSTR
jgi:hypothetical protein